VSLASEIRQALAELELISQVNAMNLAPSGRDAGEDIGGKRPPGGVDYQGDRELDYPQKSIEHFRRRLRRIRATWQLELLLEDARSSLAAARRQPAPTGEPEYGTPQWKRWVAESPLPSVEIARKYNVSRQYICRLRLLYRDAA
jgi:hypothetical protein